MSFLQNGCSVPVSARCGRHEDPNGWVHWIDVPRQPRGFEPLHHDGRYWIRRGRASVPPSATKRQELFNDFGFVLTEEQVIRAATVDDIDHHAFRTYMCAQGLDTDENPQPPPEEDMRNAGILAISDSNLHPTLYRIRQHYKTAPVAPNRWNRSRSTRIGRSSPVRTRRSGEIRMVTGSAEKPVWR